MGWGLQRTASIAHSEEEAVLIITALDEDSDCEYMPAYAIPRAADSGRKRVLCAGILLAVLVLCFVWFGPAGGHSPLTAERLTQVYTPAQATHAAKAAVGMLQVIEQRRPYADAAANLHAWPVRENTDLNAG